MTTWTQVLNSAFDAPAPQRRPVALRCGEILRLSDARGTVVRAASGRVWITEERRLADAVLHANDEHRIADSGRVVVAADRAARVVLEWPAHGSAPRAEVAAAEGEPGIELPTGVARATSWLRAVIAWLAMPESPAPANVYAPYAVRDRLAAHEPLLRA